MNRRADQDPVGVGLIGRERDEISALVDRHADFLKTFPDPPDIEIIILGPVRPSDPKSLGPRGQFHSRLSAA